jgi:transcriptional regulator with XRE-family HTH domain
MASKRPELVPIGSAVRELRVQAGLSQEQLAGAAGLHPTYVGGVERGERNLSMLTLRRLSDGLGLRPSELLERSERAVSESSAGG